MAKRITKKYRRVDSAEVQGEDSFVVFASPTFEDIANFSDLIFSENGAARSDAESIKLVVPMLKRFVSGWDWVDDEDNPLPDPKAEPDVIDRLTMEEQTFLVNALTKAFNFGSGEAAKN